MKKKIQYGTIDLTPGAKDDPYFDIIQNCCPHCLYVDETGKEQEVEPLHGEIKTFYEQCWNGFGYKKYQVLPHLCRNCKSIFLSYKVEKEINFEEIAGIFFTIYGVIGLILAVFYTMTRSIGMMHWLSIVSLISGIAILSGQDYVRKKLDLTKEYDVQYDWLLKQYLPKEPKESEKDTMDTENKEPYKCIPYEGKMVGCVFRSLADE